MGDTSCISPFIAWTNPTWSSAASRTTTLTRRYLKTSPIKTLISGPLTQLDGETMIGSFFLYEAERIEQVQQFLKDDPFNKANIWQSIDVRPFIKRVDNR
ncbi:YciI family protein [Caballeronia sp. J97]|uniref:YciI family protein n=1 Tax=Caballeronia sp. J97 TaxID=2805429 RepID=UPI002AAF37B7|nr:YciI family protein [Caballeronia sp. J97]